MKYIKKFNESFLSNAKDRISYFGQSIVLPSFTYAECKEKDLYTRAVPILTKNIFAFTRKGIKIGDEVYFLGHDGVGGWMYGDKTIADQELVDKAENLQFYKKVGTVKHSKFV